MSSTLWTRLTGYWANNSKYRLVAPMPWYGRLTFCKLFQGTTPMRLIPTSLDTRNRPFLARILPFVRGDHSCPFFSYPYWDQSRSNSCSNRWTNFWRIRSGKDKGKETQNIQLVRVETSLTYTFKVHYDQKCRLKIFRRASLTIMLN